MRLAKLSAAACALILIGAAAVAQDAPAPAPAPDAPAAQKPAKEKKICREEQVTGSIMASRTCHTRAQWAAIDGARQENVEQMQARSGGMAPGVH